MKRVAAELGIWVRQELHGLCPRERDSGVSQWPQLSLFHRPGPSGLWGWPAFRNWNITSREQDQLANFFPLTFNAIIRTHLSLSEITKEKPN